MLKLNNANTTEINIFLYQVIGSLTFIFTSRAVFYFEFGKIQKRYTFVQGVPKMICMHYEIMKVNQ